MNKYGDIEHLTDQPEANRIFLEARNLAGVRLQEQFSKANGENPESNFNSFRWIKPELTYPAFEHMTFAYKNALFAVIVEVIDGTQTSFNTKQKEWLLQHSQANNLIPCLFKIRLQDKFFDLVGRVENRALPEEYELNALADGWNLYEAATGKPLDPATMGGTERVRMSDWEMHNFAIQIVRDQLTKGGSTVLSFCDFPGENPQIWFEDKNGDAAWVVVRAVKQKSDWDVAPWRGLEEDIEELKKFPGYYAPVKFYSRNSGSPFDIARGDTVAAKFDGLQVIFHPEQLKYK